MTTEELKAHRRAICEALIEGKQCQYCLLCNDSWIDQEPQTIASVLFGSEESAQRVRIKSSPRKVWIGWHTGGYPILTTTDPALGAGVGDQSWQAEHWQLVEEQA
jgi:hypothetical protein